MEINADEVSAVLLADDWHEIAEGTFRIEDFKYITIQVGAHRQTLTGPKSGISEWGFSFEDSKGNKVQGPLTSVLAVRCGERQNKRFGVGSIGR